MRELWEEGVWDVWDVCGCGCGRGGEGVFGLLWGEEAWQWTDARAWDGGEALGWGDWVDALIFFGLEEVRVQVCKGKRVMMGHNDGCWIRQSLSRAIGVGDWMYSCLREQASD